MASTTNPYDVQPGQIWEDNDRRAKGRLLRVTGVDDEHATVVLVRKRDADRNGCSAKLIVQGSPRRIRLSRFKPTSTGYRRVFEVWAIVLSDGEDVYGTDGLAHLSYAEAAADLPTPAGDLEVIRLAV